MNTSSWKFHFGIMAVLVVAWAGHSEGQPMPPPSNSEYQIGDIVASLLDATEFQRLHGGQWALLDGRSIEGSALAMRTQVANVPDARQHRGLVLRMVDSQGERSVGDVQAASVGAHQHRYQEHHLKDELFLRTSGRRRENARRAQAEVAAGPFIRVLNVTPYARYDERHPYANLAANEGFAEPEYRSRSTATNSDEENRSASLTVNFYVKVDDRMPR